MFPNLSLSYSSERLFAPWYQSKKWCKFAVVVQIELLHEIGIYLDKHILPELYLYSGDTDKGSWRYMYQSKVHS